MSIAGCNKNNQLLAKLHEKYGTTKALPPETAFVVGHTLLYGPAGCGKTSSALKCVELAGASEENKTFFKLSADSINTTIEFVRILEAILNWEGYLCNYGKIDHKHCGKRCCIKDPVHPRGPIKPIYLFIDEIHNLKKEVQEGLLLILEDFRYQYRDGNINYDVRFPKFTLLAATTDPGLLLKPLISRFKIKLKVDRKTDQDMESVVTRLATERGLILEQKSVEVLSRISQGIPREARNHVEGLYNCWAYLLHNNSSIEGLREDIITGNVAAYYAKINNFIQDGTSQEQLNVLLYLSGKSDNGKYITAGVKKLCNSLSFDENYYLSFIEPRLILNGLIDTAQSRKITNKGLEYLNSINNNLD
jgi:Holliday junction resolvasome RuvABC ATP-dependent DNA helicase subunit